jgi:predicted GNAT family N-acyltransferase
VTVTRTHDLATCLAIRRVVFIEGQNVPEHEEVDGTDHACLHYIMHKDGQAIATARVTPLGDTAKIQRVAVLEANRGNGTGATLVRGILEDLASDFQSAKLGSQTHAIGFYEKLGFTAYGPEYDDAGIPHRDMKRQL